MLFIISCSSQTGQHCLRATTAGLFFHSYTVPCRINRLSLGPLNWIKVMWEGDVWTANSYGSFLASDLLVGWAECWLAAAISSSLGETPSQRGGGEGAACVKQSSVVRMGMSKQHNNLGGSNYVLQRWLGGGGGGSGGGPTLLQTAGAAHHLTADSYGRCDPILPRPGRPGAGLQAVRAKANKPANLWHRRRGKTTWRRWWRQGRWRMDASTVLSLTGVGQTCCLFFFCCL